MHYDEPRLRRAWLRGFRKGDVELALAERRLHLQGLQQELDAAKSRAEQLAVEVRELRERDATVRAREVELVEALSAVRTERERLEAEAQTKARELVAEAESRAAAYRSEALRHVEELQRQTDELLQLRDRLLGHVRAAVDEVSGVVHRIETDATVRPLHQELSSRLPAVGENDTRQP